MSIWDPQNEFAGVLWISLLLGILTFFSINPEFPRVFRHLGHVGHLFASILAWRLTFQSCEAVDPL